MVSVSKRSVHGALGVLLAAVAALFAVVADPGVASAHTGFASSTPAEGQTVATPVSELVVAFTGEPVLAGEGIVALDADGVIREPVSVDTLTSEAGTTFVADFEPPLAGGTIGVRWTVQAADSHPLQGSFSFVVSAPAATTPTTQPPLDDTAATVAVEPATGASSLDQFLAVDTSVPGEGTATAGRVVTLLGVVGALGALGFLAVGFVGPRRDIRVLVGWVRLLAVAIVVGAVIEYVGVGRIGADSLAETWSSSAGFATVLRMSGGVALAVGVTMVPPTMSLSSAVVDQSPGSTSGPSDERGRVRWNANSPSRWTPGPMAWLVAAGVIALLVSFWFDGHTVTKGFRPLHAVVGTVHVAAGSIWAGGVVAMALLAWTRRRAGRPTGGAELVVRFSRIAGVALGAVAVAGAVMAVFVLDSFSELTGTEWGQVLLLKTAAVALAAGFGAYNHFRLVPELERGGANAANDPVLAAELRSTLLAEAIVMTFIVIVTAVLVASAS